MSGKWTWDGTQWTGGEGTPPEPKRGGSSVLKVMLGVILGGIVLIGGCGALLAVGLSEDEKDGITASEFRSIKQGTTQGTIEDKYGEPEDAQEFEQNIPELQDKPSRSSCIYYPEKGKDVLEGRSFQLCFRERRLTSKNAF